MTSVAPIKKNSLEDELLGAVSLTPQEIVAKLDEHIIGQHKAKRAAAIALRNRWRRMKLDPELRQEVKPKNILMIGPTGVGKTEIARRLASCVDAPFIKIEATKFTEVGYVGRDVESIVRDLVDLEYKRTRERAMGHVREQADAMAEERVLDALLPMPRRSNVTEETAESADGLAAKEHSAARQVFRKKLREGLLDEKEIEIEVSSGMVGVEIMAPPGMEEMTNQLQGMFQSLNTDRMRVRKLKVKDALKAVIEEEASKLVNDEDIKLLTVKRVEQNGIIFIDEIDKIARRSENNSGGDVSREGVQRDLLPLIEGTTVNTKYSPIKTDHILFIASGAFHVTKPSDLIPELQGRLPIRVELSALSAEDFERILKEPNASLSKQYTALLGIEEVTLEFTDDGIKRIANIAWSVNERTENIGARRLHTVLEYLLEDISFDACNQKGNKFVIDAAYVEKQLSALAANEDLSQYIL